MGPSLAGLMSGKCLQKSLRFSWRGHIIAPKRYFIESSFCRNAILPNRCFAETKIAESHLTKSSHGRIVELLKLYDAERHFSESLFSRTSFSRIVVQPKVIFTNRRSAERRFPETSFAGTSFGRTLNRPPAYIFVQCACQRAAIKLMGIDVLRLPSKICVISNWVRVWTFLNMDTVRICKVWSSRYGRFDLIVVFVRSMQFRETNVRLNNDSRKKHSAK